MDWDQWADLLPIDAATVVAAVVVALVILTVLSRRSHARRTSTRATNLAHSRTTSTQLKHPSQWTTGGEQATAAQIMYARSLGFDASRMTKAQASIEIERRLGENRGPRI